MPRTVEFPKLDPTWDPYRQCVRFYALDGRVVRGCMVPIETLFQLFGVSKPDSDECLQAFRDHRSAIEEVARRKILSEPASQAGGEVLLRISDFDLPASTTTTQPPRFERLVVSLTPALAGNPELRRVVDAANLLLDAELAYAGTRAHADWDVVPTASELPLVRLILTDAETKDSAQGLFTQDDLEKPSSARSAMLGLWGQVLRERSRRLMYAFHDAGSQG